MQLEGLVNSNGVWRRIRCILKHQPSMFATQVSIATALARHERRLAALGRPGNSARAIIDGARSSQVRLLQDLLAIIDRQAKKNTKPH